MMIHNKWATPIEHKDFAIPGLAEHILTNYNMHDPPSDFNCNILEDDSQPIKDLKSVAHSNFSHYINKNFGVDINRYQCLIKGWITGHGDGYNMALHNHAGAHFSAVYYVMAEEQDQGGEIIFQDPRTNANRGYDLSFQPFFKPHVIQPKTNECVIFPSFVYHQVSQYNSRFRIAIPIDLYLYED